jgi:hypothetical protein
VIANCRMAGLQNCRKGRKKGLPAIPYCNSAILPSFPALQPIPPIPQAATGTAGTGTPGATTAAPRQLTVQSVHAIGGGCPQQ